MASSFSAIAPVLMVENGVSAVSHVCASARWLLGTRVVFNGDEYCYVYNAGNSQIDPGVGCIMSAVSGFSVTVSSITNADNCFGVVKHATLTTGTYGWVVTKGFVPLEMHANVSGAVASYYSLGGDGLWATATAGYNLAKCTQRATASAGSSFGYFPA